MRDLETWIEGLSLKRDEVLLFTVRDMETGLVCLCYMNACSPKGERKGRGARINLRSWSLPVHASPKIRSYIALKILRVKDRRHIAERSSLERGRRIL